MLKNSAEKHFGEKKGGKFEKLLIKTWSRIQPKQLRAMTNDVPLGRMRAVIERKREPLSN